METQEVASEGNTSGMVPLHEASDADVDAFVESALANPESPEPDTEDTADVENTQSAAATEDSVEETKAEPEQKKSDDKVTLSKADYEALTKRASTAERRVEDKEKFIQRQASDVGRLRGERQRLEAENERLSKLLGPEAFQDNPQAALEAHSQIRENNREIRNLETREGQIAARTTIDSFIPPEKVNVDAMVMSLERDGLDKEVIRAFRADPYNATHMHPETFIQLAKRAESEDALVRVAHWAKTEIERLEAENEALKKKPEQVLKGVENALKQAPSLTSATGGGSASEMGVPSGDPSTWDDATLNAFLEKEKKKQR